MPRTPPYRPIDRSMPQADESPVEELGYRLIGRLAWGLMRTLGGAVLGLLAFLSAWVALTGWWVEGVALWPWFWAFLAGGGLLGLIFGDRIWHGLHWLGGTVHHYTREIPFWWPW